MQIRAECLGRVFRAASKVMLRPRVRDMVHFCPRAVGSYRIRLPSDGSLRELMLTTKPLVSSREGPCKESVPCAGRSLPMPHISVDVAR